MAYIKYKEITKYFNFSKVMEIDKLPKYVYDYKDSDEIFLVGYKTSRDHGVFTNERIILFDNTNLFGMRKEITSVPYKSISSCSIVFRLSGADLSIMLSSGYPLRIKFVNMGDIDKKRLRILYSCLVRAVNDKKMYAEEVRMLQENDIKFDK